MPRFNVTFDLVGKDTTTHGCSMVVEATDAHDAHCLVPTRMPGARVSRVEQLDTPRLPRTPRFTLGKPYWPAFSKMEVRDVFDRGQRMGSVLGPQEEADAMVSLLNELP